MDYAAIASGIVASFLIPYAKAGAGKIAEGIAQGYGKVVGEKLAQSSKQVWETVKDLFTSEPEVQTLNLFRNDPETFQAPVEKMLGEKLKQNPQVAAEFSKLLNAPVAGTTSTIGSIVAGVVGVTNVTNYQGSGGTFVGVQTGVATPPEPPNSAGATTASPAKK